MVNRLIAFHFTTSDNLALVVMVEVVLTDVFAFVFSKLSLPWKLCAAAVTRIDIHLLEQPFSLESFLQNRKVLPNCVFE